MEHKRLDFNAPIISARRYAAAFPSAAPASEDVARAATNSSLPFYKSELQSGPVRRPGVVPFVWEHTPGRPKDFTPLGWIPSGKELVGSRIAVPAERDSHVIQTKESWESSKLGGMKMRKLRQEEEEEEEEEQPIRVARFNNDDIYSDALGAFSQAGSLSVCCSRSGLNGNPDAPEPSERFFTDPFVREFLIGRFLPDAQAMATGSPEGTSKKPSARAQHPKTSAGGNRDVFCWPLEARKVGVLQPKVSELVGPGSLSCSGTSHCGEKCESGFTSNKSGDCPPPMEAEKGKRDTGLSQALLPPPLPKSPSESWLSRTLSSVSSKNASPKSFGSEFQPRKKDLRESVNASKREMNVKPFKVHHRGLSFAEVLMKPVSP